MTQSSLPWTGQSVGDAGAYSAQQWWNLHKDAVSIGGQRANSGILIGSGSAGSFPLLTRAKTPNAAAVEVLACAAMVQGTYYRSDTTETLTIAANVSGFTRYDLIILRKDVTAQTVRLLVKQGTPAASPADPGLTQSASIWEIPLARVVVANNFTVIAAGDVYPLADLANAADGAYLYDIFNASGGQLEDGDVVVWTNAAPRAVTTTTTENNILIAGVVRGTIPANGYGRIQRTGIGLVKTTVPVAVGDILVTSTTAKKASVKVGYNNNALARVMEANASAGYALAAINTNTRQKPTPEQNSQAIGSLTFSTTATSLQDTGISITFSLYDTALVTFEGWAQWGSISGPFDLAINVDGTDYTIPRPTATAPIYLVIRSFILAAGSHTIKIRMSATSGATASITANANAYANVNVFY